jgi:hypothetical protein
VAHARKASENVEKRVVTTLLRAFDWETPPNLPDHPVNGLVAKGRVPAVLEETGGWKKVAFEGPVGS